jgi:hypothetical protein
MDCRTIEVIMPPKKRESGRAHARRKAEESLKTSFTSSTLLARLLERRILLQTISSSLHNICSGMIHDLIGIIVDYSESKVSFSLVGGGNYLRDSTSLFFLTSPPIVTTNSSIHDATKGSSTTTTTTTPLSQIVATTESHRVPRLTPWRRVPSAILSTGELVTVGNPPIDNGATCAILPFIISNASLEASSSWPSSSSSSSTTLSATAITPTSARLANATLTKPVIKLPLSQKKSSSASSSAGHMDDDMKDIPSTTFSLCYAGGTHMGKTETRAISLTDDATIRSLAPLNQARSFATSTVLNYDQWFVAGNALLPLLLLLQL